MSKRIIVLLTVLCVVIATLFLWNPLKSMQTPADKKQDVKKEKKKDKAGSADSNNENVSVVRKWDLPSELLEVSGIVWLGENRFACVQDEEGTVFIYNTGTGSIEKRIRFAGPGDYEGIALAANALYVMRADGLIYALDDINKDKPVVKSYQTHLTVKQDVEGFTYDKKNNRLLAAIKGSEPGNVDYKGIYAFDLTANAMDKAPVYKLSLGLSSGSSKKKNKGIEPSALAVNPTTGDLYVVDAGGPGVHILSPDGKVKSSYSLSRNDFAQPEGITFSPEGRMFISNEGKKGTGNILEVKLQ